MAGQTTNYLFDYPTSTDYVKDGATAIQTLATDVDTTLFTALGGAYPGMRLIKKQAIGTGVSTVSVTSAFSATYDAYRIIVAGGTGSTNDNIAFKMTGSGANYSFSLVYCDYSSASSSAVQGVNTATIPYVGYSHSGVGKSAIFDVINPFLTTYTTIHANTVGNTLSGTVNGIHKASTSYTGFELSSSASLTGGTVYVYGYGAS